LLFGPAPSSLTSATLGAASGGLRLEVPGATALEVMRATPNPDPSSLRDDPWSFDGPGPGLDVPAPRRSGWHVVDARTVVDGVVTDLARWRFLADPPAAEDVSSLGLVPAPKQLTLGRGELRLRPGARVCAEESTLDAAVLLAEEATRLTGVSLEALVCTARRGDLVVELRGGRAPSDAAAWSLADRADAFYLEIGSSGARVIAADRRGATYGALALADLLGFDGRAPALTAADWPDSPWRPLVHSIYKGGASGKLDVDLYIDFLRRAVARGRFDTFVLFVDGGYAWETVPELRGRTPLSREDLTRLIAAGRALGLDVVPGLQSPGHAGWLLSADSGMREDVSAELLCTRHPEGRRLLAAAYDELRALFDQPEVVMIGHDEARWRTRRNFAEERCPRCSGTPAWRLFADDLAWHAAELEAHGARPLMWADMLVPEHNGGATGTARSLDLLPDALRERFVVMTWSRNGDPERALGSKVELIRGSTGYQEARRTGLEELGELVVGEGLNLSYPGPWTLFGTATGPRALDYTWLQVILSGATAWRHDLVHTPLDVLWAHVRELPLAAPGYAVPAGWSGRTAPLTLDGAAMDDAHELPELPASVGVRGVDFALDPVVVRAGQPLRAAPPPDLAAVSLLMAAWPTHEALTRMRRDYWRDGSQRAGAPFGQVVLVGPAGEEHAVPLRYGLDTFRPTGGGPIQALWNTAGSWLTDSSLASSSLPGVGDVAYFRRDVVVPWATGEVVDLRVEVDVEGLDLVVLGVSGLKR
jgi:hypothetical protein